jgi:hypothetical protein
MTIQRPILKHSLHPYISLYLQSSSTFSPSSPASQPTRRLQVTPLRLFLPFSVLLFSALAPLRYHSTIRTSNISVSPTLWSTSCSLSFAGKMHQATSHLIHLVADPAALRLLAYPHVSKIGFVVTRPCSRNRQPAQGSTTDCSPGEVPALCASSV